MRNANCGPFFRVDKRGEERGTAALFRVEKVVRATGRLAILRTFAGKSSGLEQDFSSDCGVAFFCLCSKICFSRRRCLAIFVFKKVLRETRGLVFFFDFGLLGLFSRCFGADKEVGAQSGCGGVELLEDFIARCV